MQKSSKLYLLIIAIAVVLIGVMVWTSIPAITDAFSFHPFIGVLAVICSLFIAYFWLNGTKDVVYTLLYHLRMKKRLVGGELLPGFRTWEVLYPKVVLVYCTCNDFSAESLRASLYQDYPNYQVVILDDSNKPEYMQMVDEFAAKHRLKVIRRVDRAGFKAGNINNYLMNDKSWKYFGILDSDEVVPPNFIDRLLDYFGTKRKVGVVQANHMATRNRNSFMQQFSIGVDSHWVAYQTVKDRFGFMSLLGHGAMVSRECYEAVEGFPHVVAEDLCFSIQARSQGFLTVFAPDVMCEEEYPVDYMAFKKRHSKWTQGNMEFIRNYTWTIMKSKMNWYEKLDIVLFTYSLPLTAVFSLYLVINVVVFPFVGFSFIMPVWMLVPTILFLMAPMLNDVFFYAKTKSRLSLLNYLLHSTLLYGSMFLISLSSSIKSAFGKSVFIVTPKEDQYISFRQSIWLNKNELLFGAGLLAISLTLSHSVLPVLLIAIPALSAAYLARKHNRQVATSEVPLQLVE